MRQRLLLSVGSTANCLEAAHRQACRGLGLGKRAANLCCYDGYCLAERATSICVVGPADVLAEAAPLDHHVLQVGEPEDAELKLYRYAQGLDVITEWVPLLTSGFWIVVIEGIASTPILQLETHGLGRQP